MILKEVILLDSVDENPQFSRLNSFVRVKQWVLGNDMYIQKNLHHRIAIGLNKWNSGKGSVEISSSFL